MKIKWNKTVQKRKTKISQKDSKMIKMKEAIQIESRIHKSFYRKCKKHQRKFKNRGIYPISLNVHMNINKLFL